MSNRCHFHSATGQKMRGNAEAARNIRRSMRVNGKRAECCVSSVDEANNAYYRILKSPKLTKPTSTHIEAKMD